MEKKKKMTEEQIEKLQKDFEDFQKRLIEKIDNHEKVSREEYTEYYHKMFSLPTVGVFDATTQEERDFMDDWRKNYDPEQDEAYKGFEEREEKRMKEMEQRQR